jgi:GAF domain-containing protein/anti-sigma regulatory factor (Ser/Thr protein kinase)
LRVIEGLRLPVPGPFGTRPATPGVAVQARRATYDRHVETWEASPVAGAGTGEALAALQRVTDAALAHLSLDDLLAELMVRIAEVLHTDTSAILLADHDTGMLHARAAKGIEEEVEQGVRIPIGRGFAGRVAAERRPVTIPDLDRAEVLNPILRQKGIRSLLGVPLLVEGRVLGVMHVGTLVPREFTARDVEVLQVVADRVALAIDHAQLYERERAARERSERALRVLESVQRVTDAALAYLSAEDLLDALLDRMREILNVDTAAILLLEHDGRMLRARAAKGIEEEVEQGVRIPVGRGFAGRIAAERHPIAILDVDHADVLNPLLRQKGIRSLLGVPLLVEGRVTGVLHVGTRSPRAFTDQDRDLLQAVADRAALAIDHAQLFERERRARERAERDAMMLQSVQRVTDAALAYLSTDDLLDELLERMREILHADTAAILMLEDNRRMLRARAAKGIEEEVEAGVRIPLGRGFAGRIAAERRAITIPDVDHADIFNPILRQKGIRSLLGVPLLVEGRVIGVLHVGTLVPRDFTEADRDLLQLAADRAALAIEQASLYEQRRLAEALQRALLPQQLVEIPAFEVAARYLPAAPAAGLGGDWYDVFPVGGGRIGVAVGDVVGRGLPAAALMAQLRTALRAYAFDGHSPSAVIDRLNRLLAYLRPATMTTAVYLVLDLENESGTMVSAGHPPPLVIAPDGSASYLPPTGGIALGVSRGTHYREQEFALPSGSTIVLYTDGVVEVRGEALDDGLERLRRLAERGHESADALCDAVVDEMVADGRPADDVALLAARAEPLGDRIATRWPAQPEALSTVRHLLRRWLRHHGATDDEMYDITVACQEACANAIEHAYAPGDEAFEVEAVRSDSAIEITVRDHGRWRPARGTHRGRGMSIMEALMKSVDVQHTADGTAVLLRRRLTGAES